jgi:hypothetical protein
MFGLGVDKAKYPDLDKRIMDALEKVARACAEKGVVPDDLQAGPCITAMCDGTATPMQQATALGIIMLLKRAIEKLPADLGIALLGDGPPPMIEAQAVPKGMEHVAMAAAHAAVEQTIKGSVPETDMDDPGFGKTWRAPSKGRPN